MSRRPTRVSSSHERLGRAPSPDLTRRIGKRVASSHSPSRKLAVDKADGNNATGPLPPLKTSWKNLSQGLLLHDSQTVNFDADGYPTASNMDGPAADLDDGTPRSAAVDTPGNETLEVRHDTRKGRGGEPKSSKSPARRHTIAFGSDGYIVNGFRHDLGAVRQDASKIGEERKPWRSPMHRHTIEFSSIGYINAIPNSETAGACDDSRGFQNERKPSKSPMHRYESPMHRHATALDSNGYVLDGASSEVVGARHDTYTGDSFDSDGYVVVPPITPVQSRNSTPMQSRASPRVRPMTPVREPTRRQYVASNADRTRETPTTDGVSSEGDDVSKTLVGSRVKVHGLQKKTDLNGREGTCSRMTDGGRWEVVLDGSGVFAFKLDNLEALPSDSRRTADDERRVTASQPRPICSRPGCQQLGFPYCSVECIDVDEQDSMVDDGALVQLPMKRIFFDFDQTIARCHVFHMLSGNACESDRSVSPPFAETERGQIYKIEALNNEGTRWVYDDARHRIVLDESGGDMWTRAALGGAWRVEALKSLFAYLRAQGIVLTIITKGYVGAVNKLLEAEDLLEYFDMVIGMLGDYYLKGSMRESSEYDRSNRQQSSLEGKKECALTSLKADCIRSFLEREGLQESQAVHVDDDPAEIFMARRQ